MWLRDQLGKEGLNTTVDSSPQEWVTSVPTVAPPTCLCSSDDVPPVHLETVAECDLQKALWTEEGAENVFVDVGVEPCSLQVHPANALLPVVVDLIQGNQYCTWAIPMMSYVLFYTAAI